MDGSTDPDYVGPGTVDLVYAHPVDGYVATLHAFAFGNDQPHLVEIRLWFAVLPLDYALFNALTPGGAYAIGTNRRRTGLFHGVSVTPHHRRRRGSLRVVLAGLRAFTVPAWTLDRLWLGSDGSDQIALHHQLCEQAPAWALSLIPARS